LTAALKASEVDAVLHFSKRSAENYLAGARGARIADKAVAVRHLCLSQQIAAPLAAAGAKDIAVAKRADEAELLELVGADSR
jgi:uroporphyrinogen-III synthase